MRKSTVAWHAALIALAVCGAGAAMAQSDPAPVAEAAGKPDDAEPRRPFIERSLVIAPEQVGKFELYGMNDYPGQPGAGIHVRYRHEDFPDVRVDLFVYPAGRVDSGPLLDRAMDEMRHSLQDAVEKGSYSNLELGDEGSFDLRRVDADGSLLPASDPDAKGGSGSAFDQTLADVAAAADYRAGRVLEARLNIGEEAVDSRGYLFYRGLYLVKGRISASPKVLPGESFDRFSRHAMATLVPVLATRSTGGCSQIDVYIDPDAEDAGETFAKTMVAQAARAEQEQCSPALDETVPEGHRAMPLVYPPEMWKG